METIETEKIVTTADMLEIVAGGGNGSEYVDVSGLIETAAKELREKDAEIEKLRSIIKKADAILAEKDDHWSERIEGARNALFEGLEETR